MATGVAVVAYDCDGLRLLPACHVAGTYAYTGSGHDAKVVQIFGADDVRATLPSTGAGLQWPALRQLQAGATLDVALVTAGRKRATVGYATAQQLAGDCRGATHLVRAASVGAFAVDAGTLERRRDVAGVFDAGARGGSILSATERRAQGTLAACAASQPGDTAPPEGCDAVFRVELSAIDTTGPLDGTPRPLGGQLDPPGPEPLRTCNTADTSDCEAQCHQGEQNSCYTLGWMYENGRGVPRDLDRARSLYQGACVRRAASGCRGLGWLYTEGIGVPRDMGRGVAFYADACDAGDAESCSNLGHLYGTGEGLPRDYDRAFRFSRKGCDGGDPNGCNNLGVLAENGWGVAHDASRAAGHYRQACDGGSARGCTNLGYLLVQGRGVPGDRAQGIELLRRGCAGGSAWGCEKLQKLGLGR
jgi:hypothetical protein